MLRKSIKKALQTLNCWSTNLFTVHQNPLVILTTQYHTDGVHITRPFVRFHVDAYLTARVIVTAHSTADKRPAVVTGVTHATLNIPEAETHGRELWRYLDDLPGCFKQPLWHSALVDLFARHLDVMYVDFFAVQFKVKQAVLGESVDQIRHFFRLSK